MKFLSSVWSALIEMLEKNVTWGGWGRKKKKRKKKLLYNEPCPVIIFSMGIKSVCMTSWCVVRHSLNTVVFWSSCKGTGQGLDSHDLTPYGGIWIFLSHHVQIYPSCTNGCEGWQSSLTFIL